jgi:hypothetical protein
MLEGETREEAIKRYQEAKAGWEETLRVSKANPNVPITSLITGQPMGTFGQMIPELERIIANCDKEMGVLNG